MSLRSLFHRTQSVQKKRRTPHVRTRRRPRFEALEDRLTLSFAYWGAFPQVEFNQITGPDLAVDFDSTPFMLQLESADFNADWKSALIAAPL